MRTFSKMPSKKSKLKWKQKIKDDYVSKFNDLKELIFKT